MTLISVDVAALDFEGQVRDLLQDIREELVKRPGYFRMTVGAGLVEQQYYEIITSLSKGLGRLLPQDAEGTLVRQVRNRGTQIGEGSTSRYSDSRFGGSLHTDGAERPFPVPEIFGLLCVRQAPAGGELVMVHVDDVVDRLSPATMRVLREPLYFDRRGDQSLGESPVAAKPVLTRSNDTWIVTYLREYIEAGHRHPDAKPLTDAQRAALEEFDHHLSDPSIQRNIRMLPGELSFFNNLEVLHGRTTFQESHFPADARLLLRTWVSTQ